mmetsp:Transcript_10946/g.20395  ORF Transcript_10946/g.20395 Transcript_10946/m.20395 type:complete len:85 (-) Transcript_10946:84-338(-)
MWGTSLRVLINFQSVLENIFWIRSVSRYLTKGIFRTPNIKTRKSFLFGSKVCLIEETASKVYWDDGASGVFRREETRGIGESSI